MPSREWRNDDAVGRRHELYARAAPVFRKHGYAGATLKALALACELSIPALYRYFPSKRAFALYPLMALYPELHRPPPVTQLDTPELILALWVEGAAREMPNYVLAQRLALEVGLRPEDQRRLDSNLTDHVGLLAGLARRAAPILDEQTAGELAWSLVYMALAPSLGGPDANGDRLRRQLQALLRGYGINLEPSTLETARSRWASSLAKSGSSDRPV